MNEMNRRTTSGRSVGSRNGAAARRARAAVEAGRDQPVAAATVRRVEPTGREVMFGTEEILVTKTDLTGHITYSNEVFLKVAGYAEEETIGRPHSFIRHPDMPRCVFKLLWDSIEAGREIFAYVFNMSRSGDHYWVMAHVTPTVDEHGRTIGFHSNRRCPDRGQVAQIKPIYDLLLAEERKHTRKADALDASMQLLEKILAERGQTYEQFVFSI
jgi:PAS domain S-box-containing protein